MYLYKLTESHKIIIHSCDSGPGTWEKMTESGPIVSSNSPRLNGITVDRSVEFSHEELSKATNDFSLENKIGQGGFGSVFYGELRGEVCAHHPLMPRIWSRKETC